MSELISIENLSFRYVDTDFYSLNNVNLKINKGDFVLLCGPSGCGKTTLLRAINGLIPNYYQGEYKGKVIIENKEVSKHKTYEIAKIAGLVFQDPENQLFTSSVEKEIAFGLENLAIPRDEMRRIVNETIRVLNLENLRYKVPAFLSGGEQQKVAIAAIYAMRPKVLLLDEPLSNLDPYSAISVIELIYKLNKELGLTILIAEHRLDWLIPFSNRIVIMNEGRILIEGETRSILEKFDLEQFDVNDPKIPTLAKRINKIFNLRIKISLTVGEFVDNFKKELNDRI
jgi:energy-coupling factor transporter ATP-binding protein EcfA2